MTDKRINVQDEEILKLYLNEITKIKRLSESETKNLINRLHIIKKNLKLYEKKYKSPIDISFINGNKKISKNVKIKLINMIKERDLIKEKLITSNLPLVVKIARNYKTTKLTFLDLISEGNIGLIEGIERFEKLKGVKLSTYVSLWIKARINECIIKNTFTIVLPKYVQKILKRYKEIYERLSQEIGTEPEFNQIVKKISIPLKKLLDILQYIHEPISLDAEIEKGKDLSDYVEDKRLQTPFEFVYYSSLIENLEKLINKLNYREQIILKMRYGLYDSREHSFSEIGKFLGISGERVRQILKTALGNLKSLLILSGKYSELSV